MTHRVLVWLHRIGISLLFVCDDDGSDGDDDGSICLRWKASREPLLSPSKPSTLCGARRPQTENKEIRKRVLMISI